MHERGEGIYIYIYIYIYRQEEGEGDGGRRRSRGSFTHFLLHSRLMEVVWAILMIASSCKKTNYKSLQNVCKMYDVLYSGHKLFSQCIIIQT